MVRQHGRHMSRRDFLRIAGVGAAGMAAGSLLSGCQVPAPTKAAGGQPTAAVAPGATAEAVTLRYQNQWSRETDAHYTAMEWVYKTFQERNPGIKLDVVVIPQGEESARKIQADCATGNCPDILHEVYLDFFDAGWIMDLAPYIDAEWKARMVPEPLEELTWDGKIFGVSLEYSPMACCWNTRILEQVGREIPKTWDETLSLGEALKGKGLYLTAFEAFALMGFTGILMGRPGAAEALAKDDWTCEQVLFAFQRLKELVDNKLIPPNDVELDWRQASALWTAGRMPLSIFGGWNIKNEITAEGADPELRNHVVFSPVPSTGNGTSIQVINATGMGLAASLLKQPKRLEAALTFLKFWTSDEAANVFVTEAQSPMGIKTDIPADKVPLLAGLFGAVKQADIVFSLPRSRKLRARAWDHPVAGYQAVLLGKSAEEATEIYAAELSK